MLKLLMERAENTGRAGTGTGTSTCTGAGRPVTGTENTKAPAVVPVAEPAPAPAPVPVPVPPRERSNSRRFVSRLAGDEARLATVAPVPPSGGAFVPVARPSQGANLIGTSIRTAAGSNSTSSHSAGKDVFEAEALKLKQDLQSMQSALNDRMNRYRR